MGTRSGLTQSLLRLLEPGAREDAVRELAAQLGVESVFIFTPDPELGVLLPAPGFPKTLPAGPAFRTFVSECQTRGQHQAELPSLQTQKPLRALGHCADGENVLVLLGGAPAAEDVTALEELLPFVARGLRNEQSSAVAAGNLAVEREAAQRATALAQALDVARRDLSNEMVLREQREAELRKRVEFEQQLIGIVSHDLRNPLNAINVAATLLRRQSLNPPMSAAVNTISSAVERATRMISDLLDFTQARLGGGIPVARASLDLHHLIRQLVEELRSSYPEREITLAMSGEGRGEWDADRLAQAVINVIINALSYSPAETAVQVAIDGADGAVVLTVHNEGKPIPPELLPHLFEPMHQGQQKSGEKQSRSIGLGLYIVRHIVEAHEGTINVHSTEAEGTTFKLTLPRSRVSD